MHTRFAIGATLASLGMVLGTLAAPPPAPDALTEGAAAQWDALADFASASVSDDGSRVLFGSTSLRFDTTGGFDTWLWSPPLQDANWDLSQIARLSVWVYAVNNNLGFQNYSPWIHLGTDPANYFVYTPSYDLLNDARNTWIQLDVPLAGDSFWTRTAVGSPNLAQVNFIEFHADTWEAGFSVWFDGLTFDSTPALPDGLAAIAGDHKVELRWLPYAAGPGFSHFAVYRRTTAFTSVSGLSPLATISDVATTGFVDSSAVNGTRYHYAVTAVNAQGLQETTVDPVGPRTPRHETDLHVLCIERTPRYPRYAPQYTYYQITEPSGFGPYGMTAATSLGLGQTAGTQRFPNPGDTVTYTAFIRNRGTTTIAGPVQGEWTYDGVSIGTAQIPGPLAPGASGSAAITRTWDGVPHEIAFAILTPDDKPANSTLAVDTSAVAFLSFVDRTYEEDFREESPSYPLATSDDIIHWLHLHMAEFNRMFIDSGSSKRVKLDVLHVLEDLDPNPVVNTIDFAIFPFRYRAGDGTLRHTGYYRPEVDIDYGLLHEMGHQLGLVDLYRLDLPADRNHVSGQAYSGPADLMLGCSPFLSPHSSLAMDHWLDVAHGYYGQYLYSIPANIRMRFVNLDGEPIEGATVKVYQKIDMPGQGEIIPDMIKAQGTTDANGEWVLPNVPIDTNLVPTTFAGDALGPNPFGYVAVVANNGVLHFRVEKSGGADYAWLDITEVNVAYWQGQTTEAVFERQVAVGGPVQFIPPLDMAELNALHWGAWAQGSDEQGTFVTDETRTGLHPVGAASIKLTTDGDFDSSLRYPVGITGQWDLSAATHLNLSLRTSSAGLFQNGSPWIRLGDSDGNYYEYRYYSGGAVIDKLNETRGAWKTYAIPLNAPANPGTGWGRSITKTPDLAHIQSLEIHADTSASGYYMWVDGVSITPQPFCRGDGNYDAVIDLRDFAALQRCWLENPCSVASCAMFDADGSCSVDAADLAEFNELMLGPAAPLTECVR